MTVIEGNADSVEAETLEECGVLILKEVLEKLVEEQCCLGVANGLRKGFSNLKFAARITSDEVLHARISV